MRKLSFLLVPLVLLTVACGIGRAPAAPSATPPPTFSPVTTPTVTPTPAPGSTPAAAVPAALSLTITAPQDEVVVKDSILRVMGRTSPDAVVSVNGNIVRSVDMDGNFSAAVSLLEGPNLLEVIATDYGGSQASQVLTVIYTPQG